MEWILTLCNLFATPMVIFCALFLLVGSLWGASKLSEAMDSGYGSDDEKTKAISLARFLVVKLALFWAMLCLTASLCWLPQSLIQARIQMIKLEITDEGTRERIYENIDRVFERIEEKYLGPKKEK